MTISAITEVANYKQRSRKGSFWRRALIAASLMTSDLLCFAVADLLMRLFQAPPGIVLFRGRVPDRMDDVIDLIVILALIFVVTRYIAGDYSRRKLFWDGARTTTSALLICGFLCIGATMFLLPTIGVIISGAIWLILIVILPCARQVTRYLLGRIGVWYQPTAIIGTNATAHEVFPELSGQLSLGLDVRWVVLERHDLTISPPLSALVPIYADPADLSERLIALGCQQVILAAEDNMPMEQVQLIDQMVGADIAISVVPSLRRLPVFGMSASYFFGSDLVLLQVRNNLARLPPRILKRTIDLAGSAFALVLLLPLFVIFAVLIKREDSGPIFFLQSRVGRNGEDFRCWKFRTMAVDAEAQLARWVHENPGLLAHYRESNFKLKCDPRVTRVGAWLRRTSLDELPQIINVLLGEMSLVGPRPLLRRELPEYGAVISLYKRVRPGITGLWQISGRSHTSFAERVSSDEWYIKNWTIWYDVVIMFQTLWVLTKGEGAY